MSENTLVNAIPIWSFFPATDDPQFIYEQSMKNANVSELKDILDELIVENGTVCDMYEGHKNQTTIIFKDVPYDWSARLNISWMLTALLDLRIIGALFTDGAHGYLHTIQITSIPIPEVKKEVATFLVKKLKINPTEYSQALYTELVRQEHRKHMKKGEDAIRFDEKLERSMICNQEIKTIPICGVDHWGIFACEREIWKKYPTFSNEELTAMQKFEKERASFMVDEILRRMQEANVYTSSFTCCGDTSELICSTLKNYEISYLLLSPKITEQNDIDTYMKEIRGELSPLEKLLSEK